MTAASILAAMGSGGLVGSTLGLIGGGGSILAAASLRGRCRQSACRNRNGHACCLGQCLWQRGLSHGDVAELFNDRGRCIVSLDTSQATEPGIVVLPTGGWFDPVRLSDGTTIDRGGNANVLTPDKGTSRLGQGSAPNTCLVDLYAISSENLQLRAERP